MAPELELGCLCWTRFGPILRDLGPPGDDLRDPGGAKNAKNDPVKSSVLPHLDQTEHSTVFLEKTVHG